MSGIVGNLLITGCYNAYGTISNNGCTTADTCGYVVFNHVNSYAAGYACTAACYANTNTDIGNLRRCVGVNGKVVNIHCAAIYRSIGLLDNTVNGNACTDASTAACCRRNIGGAGNFAGVLRVNGYIGFFAAGFVFINAGIIHFCAGGFVYQRGCRCALYSHITCTANADCHVDYSCFVFSFNFNRAVCTVRINSAVFNFCRYMLFGFLFIIRNTADFRIGNAAAHCCRTCTGNGTDNGKNIGIIKRIGCYGFGVVNGYAIHNSTGSAVRLRNNNRAAYCCRTCRAYACTDVVAVAGVCCFCLYACAISFIIGTFIKGCIYYISFSAVIKPNIAQHCANARFAADADLPANGNHLRRIGCGCRGALRFNNGVFNIYLSSVINVVPAYAAHAAAFSRRTNAARNGNNVAARVRIGF